MITIQHLEVHFDVEGAEEDVAFARLFKKYISRWSRAEAEQRANQQRAEQERALGDRPVGEKW